MSLAAALIQELHVEAATTRRVLERVPDAQLSWSPAPKSRSLGHLAMHNASNPDGVTAMVIPNPTEFPGISDTMPTSTAEVLATLDASVAAAATRLAAMSDADLAEVWRVHAGDRELMAMPRIAFLRTVLLNHWYHHRGQLSVYLRLRGVPLPSIYGPSADENPFM